MTFEELLEKVKTVHCQEARAHEKDYCEVVIAKSNLDSMLSVLNGYFGLPLKPAGKKPSQDAQAYAKSHGGVYDDQTLFHRKEGACSELALLWPWGSGAAVTVKIARETV